MAKSAYHNILLESRLMPAGHLRQEWDVKVPAEVPLDDILVAGYWKQVSQKITLFDKVNAISESGLFYAELLVIAVEKGQGVKMHVMRSLNPNEIKEEVKEKQTKKKHSFEEYEIKHAGSVDKWRVIRKADRTIISKGFATKTEANQSLVEHMNTLMAA